MLNEINSACVQQVWVFSIFLIFQVAGWFLANLCRGIALKRWLICFVFILQCLANLVKRTGRSHELIQLQYILFIGQIFQIFVKISFMILLILRSRINSLIIWLLATWNFLNSTLCFLLNHIVEIRRSMWGNGLGLI